MYLGADHRSSLLIVGCQTAQLADGSGVSISRQGNLCTLAHLQLLQIKAGHRHVYNHVLVAGNGKKTASLGCRTSGDSSHFCHHAGKLCLDSCFACIDVILGHLGVEST